MNNIKFNKFRVTIDNVVAKYKDSGRFSETFINSLNESLQDRDMRIAVIGKMKAGKSTFTNALVFQDNVLPSGVEPTTVTLTEISYLAELENDTDVEVEILTETDIKEIKKNQNDTNQLKASAARKIMENLSSVPGGYEQYVHKEPHFVKIPFDELIHYTAAKGKLSGLAKRVIIKKKTDALKGVTIIDTPGFNDPVSSRGEATKEALKDCNIILFVHDYLDKYDQEEISILTEQVEYTGVAVIVDIINMIDDAGLSIAEWPSFVQKFNRKKEEAKKQITAPGIFELLNESKTTYVSALMALVGYSVKKSRLDDNEKEKLGLGNYKIDDETKSLYMKYQEHYNELKDEDDFIEYSHIGDVVEIINKLSEDKSKYLTNYPLATLIGELKMVATTIDNEKQAKEEELNDLQMSITDAQSKINALDSMFKPLQSLVKNSMLSSVIRNDISSTKKKIQNKRSEMIPGEFSENTYLDVSIGKYGQKKINLARYQNFLFDFDDIIRNELEALKNKIITDSKDYINKLGEQLVNNQISKEDRGSFIDALLRSVHKILDNIVIDVDPDMPSSPLDGDQKQYALYKSDFMSRYKDSEINEYLRYSYNACTIIDDEFLSEVRKEVGAIKTRLMESVNFNPQQKEEKINSVKEEISYLMSESSEVDNDIKKLTALKNEKV